ncbi:HEAT repeat domain-containing protein [Dactylosporangium sp. CS-033363]|uniref:HEAT repeat domain-containing protein n=1 Tax=Dactylosporangium sp. CS-033363 TaxID=3239935 RepID=UPI003D8CB2D2
MTTLQGLSHTSSSVRLQAALAIGTHPDTGYVDSLVARCAIEPDFYVRDMLTWALTRHPAALTVPRLIAELRDERAQARSQALHTLSKIGDRAAWPAITHALLTDADDQVARTAWRTAVALAPDAPDAPDAPGAPSAPSAPDGADSGADGADGADGGADGADGGADGADERAALAAVLATQLGRGDRETQLSLSRALVALGDTIEQVLHAAANNRDVRVRRHAAATARLLRDPDAAFELGVEEAKRVFALGPTGQEA